jgi:hypothetical protein
MAYFPFGEYDPDVPSYLNTGVTVAKNVIPGGKSYKPLLQPAVYSSNGLNSACKGAVSGRDNAGNPFNFAASATKIYQMTNSAWADVSIAANYSTSTDGIWEFTQWGNQILATNFIDPIQTFTMGSSSLFANLGGTPPKARNIAVVRDFVVTANTNDSDGVLPYRVRWSAIGNEASWTVSSTTQADFQSLDGPGGWNMKIVGGEYGVIFQERAIWRMTYVGSPAIFQFDQVESARGTPASGSVVKVGNYIAYLGIDGFYIFDGQQSVPIGSNRINQFFFSDLDQSYLYNICSAVDPTDTIIYWAYPGIGNSSGRPNKLLMYNYSPDAEKRWSYAETETEFIFLSLGQGYTLDQLDNISTNLDSLPFSLDSRFWTGTTRNISGFNSSHKLFNYTGTAFDATLETGEANLFEGHRAEVTKVRPVVDGSGTTTIQIGTRNNLSDSVTWGASTSLTSSGFAPVRSNARFHRMRVNISGGFNHAQGVEVVDFVKGGVR